MKAPGATHKKVLKNIKQFMKPGAKTRAVRSDEDEDSNDAEPSQKSSRKGPDISIPNHVRKPLRMSAKAAIQVACSELSSTQPGVLGHV